MLLRVRCRKEGRSVRLGWNAAIWAVLGAIAGGILLNLMPCVFPILALKTLHISRAGGGSAHARSDALAYAAGTIVGTGALGAVLLAIRAAGSEAGWAFQLQDPRAIMLLLLLAVAITANLLGLFELPVLGGASQPAGSFGTGALAAFVATPCAGPFLGAALGTALLLPAAGSIFVFAALGSGSDSHSSLLLSSRPCAPGCPNQVRGCGACSNSSPFRWLRVQPRLSGFSIARLPTRLFSSDSLRQRRSSYASISSDGCSALAVLRPGLRDCFRLVVVIAAVARIPASPTTRIASPSGAEPWSEARAASYVGQGKPVFVYFTADWCLSCKVNEATSIDRDEVRDAFRKAGVEVLAGDWTNGDPAITRFLESQGRAGVPLYLWYAPGKPVEQLPQVLTPGDAHFPRSGAAAALGSRLQTFFPPTHVSRTSVRASSCAFIFVESRSTMTKSAHLPGSSEPILSSAKPA